MFGSTRRTFLLAGCAAFGAAAAGRMSFAEAAPTYPRFRKAIKYHMIRIKAPIEQQFAAIKSLGFEGVEVEAPTKIDLDEMVAASKATGIKVHGVIDAVQWKIRLSDPSEEVRAKALEALQGAIEAAKKVGATTVLLVPGKVSAKEEDNENYQQVWDRSIAEIKKVLPQAKEANVKIAIEVVWNDLFTKPQHMVDYIDAFNDPIVGGYFDPSNVVKHGIPPADWIRALGHRLLKFDFKAYSHKTKFRTPIGEGDEDWPEVRKALGELKYDGWATAEVGGGDEKWLKQVSQRMDKVLGLA